MVDLATGLDSKSKGIVGESGGVPIVLVPQANLVSKVKNSGKSIQYHGQVAKAIGKELFRAFVRSIELVALEQQHIARKEEISAPLKKALIDLGGAPSDSPSNKNSSGGVDPSLPPEKMFRDTSLYESWDDVGFPLAKIGGEALTKSAIKKMKKQHAAQKKRYDKYLASGGANNADPMEESAPSAEAADEGSTLKLDPNYIRVISGTFGNLQALSFNSDMGPFCHLVNVG